MKKLYGLNPMAPEFVPKVIRAGQPLIMASSHHHYASVGLPPFCPPPPPPSSMTTAAAAAASAGFPPFPPPPPFHPQWLLPCSPRRQQPLINATRNVRMQFLPLSKTTNLNRPLSGLPVPPPVENHGQPFSNVNSSVHPPFSHLRIAPQVSSSFYLERDVAQSLPYFS